MERRFFLTGTAFSGAGITLEKGEKKKESKKEVAFSHKESQSESFATVAFSKNLELGMK